MISEGGPFTTWIGTLVDPKKEYVYFVEKDKAHDIAERLVRIGYRSAGFNNFTIEDWKAKGNPVTVPKFATVADLKNTPDKFILDVRGEG